MSNLSTHQLAAGYGNKEILRDLDLSIEPGCLVCLLGVNGSGKSTLLRTLGGFQEALSGEVMLAGKVINKLKVSERAKQLSVVFTHNYISGMMTAGEVVSLGRYPYTNWLATLNETDHQQVEDALALTGMSSEKDSYFDELSDGQQQKIIISRAVAQDTPVIILDEPTNHLDIGNKAEILQLLQSLAHDKNKSILVSTHDLDLALQMADELWVISGDSVIVGPPEELLMNGVLDQAFPYDGIDLFSGKVIKPATRSTVYLKGSGRNTEVTQSALRRLGFKIVQKESDSSIQIEVKDSGGWEFRHKDNLQYLERIDQLLKSLESY